MSKLTKLAKDRECQVRMPGICCGDNSTVVLAHLHIAGISGRGLKAPDLLGAWCCSSCHDEYDRRTQKLTLFDAELCFYEGVFKTQYQLIKQGIIK